MLDWLLDGVHWLTSPFRVDVTEFGEWGGRPGGRAAVPDVRGLRVDEARHALAREGFEVDVVRLEERPAPVMGTVMDQKPAPGTRRRRGRHVTISVQHPRDPRA